MASLKLNDFKKFKLYAGSTLLLACGFLVIKYFEYPQNSVILIIPVLTIFLGIYFTMTGLHVIHVIGGIAVIAFLLFPGAKMWETDPERFTSRIEVTGLYWHFVDIVWIVLFTVVYLI